MTLRVGSIRQCPLIGADDIAAGGAARVFEQRIQHRDVSAPFRADRKMRSQQRSTASGQGEAGAPVASQDAGLGGGARKLRGAAISARSAMRPRTSDGGTMMGAAHVVGSENVAQPGLGRPGDG
jgi:hypothetical protein